ncbi:MAG TPA: glycerol-3-phosphate 1-O-acyltransferase PlsY, partial [Gammaproteobacteria bacterium]|nr:glycerol-3-phosphate 1-O-acyltransferase PlsY [Gammaproteobacteria bacterium]
MLYLILVGLAYLFGSISSAIVLCRIAGYPDPRRQGSGNPGATNIFRLYGKRAAAITLAGDLLKGLLPVLIGRALHAPDMILAGMGVAAFLGHLYPIFFQFEGGKGVAPFIGILYGLAWPAGVAFMLVWIMIAAIFRYSSL